MTAWALAFALVVLGAGVLPAGSARAQDEETPDVYARVIVDSTVLRSGPGHSFRRTYVASRGDVFPVTDRSTRAYWFRVELPDGTYGWVLGDHVYNFEAGEEESDSGRFLGWLFAPPPLPDAAAELSITFGAILEGGGIMAVRPTIYLEPTFGIEATLAASVAQGGRLLIGGVGGIVNLFPRSPIVPYVAVGTGYAISDPNADAFLLEEGDTYLLYGGGGLRFGFRYRLTIRIEARAYAFHEADRFVAQEEISGGITVFM